MKSWIIWLTAICMAMGLVSTGMAGNDTPPVLAPGEKAVVRVYYPNTEMANKVIISFEAQLLETNYGKGYHVMRVTREDVDRLTAAGLRVVSDPKWKQTLPEDAVEDQTEEGIPHYPCYRTVEETFETAALLVKTYPKLAKWIDVGDSWVKASAIDSDENTTGSKDDSGFDMRVLVLTNQLIKGEKPDLLITAAIHAREYATAELVTRFAEYMLTHYGLDPDVTWILDHHEIHLMLQSNPDGRKIAEEHIFWRKNTNWNTCVDPDLWGVDLNRNFTFEWNCCDGSSDDGCSAVYHGEKPASEPEVQAVEAYMEEIFPDQREDDDMEAPAPDDATGIYIDIHSYGQLVMWPWGSTGDEPPNGPQLQTLGRKFAYWNNYSPEQAIGLYPTDGTSDEHAYGHLGVAAYCFEVGTSFFQSCQTFENFVLPDNLPALVYAAKVVRTPYLTPAGPDAVDVSVDAETVSAGTLVQLSAAVDDTRYKNPSGQVDDEPVQAIAAAEYYIDQPPWQGNDTAFPMEAADGGFDASVEPVAATVDTANLSKGRHLIFVRGLDAQGNWGAFSAVFLNVQ